MSNLTKSELAILKALDAASDKIASRSELRAAAGLTSRGFPGVIDRMEAKYLIGRVEGWGVNFTLTFAGMKALVAEQVSA